jgi:predicted permease
MASVFLSRIRATFQRRRREAEFSDEIEAHLAMLTEDHMRRGLDPAAARLAATRDFGGVTHLREAHREARALLQFDRFIADLRYAVRGMARNPGFTLLAVLTLGLGIGVNTMLFTAYNAVVLKPLAIADPDSVYRFERWFQSGGRGNSQYAFSWSEYVRVRDQSRGFAGVVAAAWSVGAVVETGGSQAMRAQVQMTSANYFDALGVAPKQGRGFVADDDRAASTPVAVVNPAFARRLAISPGGTIKLNGVSYTIIGIAPDEFTGTAQAPTVPDVWVPAATMLRDPGLFHFQILGRLNPATRAATARAEATVLVRQSAGSPLGDDPTVDVTLEHPSFLDNTDDPRFQALAAGVMLLVGTVLLVACANLANLMLARGAGRQKEIGVRLALGASRRRLIRQLLTENMVLGVAGGVAGLLMSQWTARMLWGWARTAVVGRTAGDVRLSLDASPDARVLLYALSLSLFAGILFGLLPALRCTRCDLTSAIKDDTSALGIRLGRSRLRALLIGGQVAVSMTLLITAGLLTRGLTRAHVADPGFDARTLFTLYADWGKDPVAHQRRLLDRLRTLPEVVWVAEGGPPLSGTWTPPMVAGEISGRTLASYGDDQYLDVLGLRIHRGRGFARREVMASAPVAVISEGAARRFWPAGDPVGRRFRLDMNFRGSMQEFEVIGVVKDARLANLSRVDPAHIYLTTRHGDFQPALIRVLGDPRNAIASIRRAVRESDPALLPGLAVESIAEGPMWQQQFRAQAMAVGASILAGLALVLACAGIYGVMAYLVAQRTREIGVRMALGAGASRVVREVVIAGLRPVFGGMAVGIGCAAAISAVLHTTLQFPGAEDFLYGVSFYDPVAFVGLSVLVLALAALASAVPARRAVKVDPLIALRYE